VDFTLTPEAAALTAVRAVDGELITYTIADPEQGRPAIERTLNAANALGYLAAPEGEPYGVLDILNAQDDIVQDFALPTEEAFTWFENRLGLHPTPAA
jgi:hypothetical protein